MLDDPDGLVSLTCDPYPCRAVVIQRQPIALRDELTELGFEHLRLERINHLSTDGERSQRVFAPEAAVLVFPAQAVPPESVEFLEQLMTVTRHRATQELNTRGQAVLDAAWEDAQRESP